MSKGFALNEGGYVDLHVHILPGVDDGVSSWDEAVQMAHQLWAQGVQKLVVTPHNSGFQVRLTREKVISLMKELEEKLRQEGIPLELYPGIEVMLEPSLFHRLEKGEAFTLNSSRYILVEMPLFSYPVYTEELLFKLQVNGYKPILAHPERNLAFQERPELLYPLVKRGVLIQLTSASIIGEMGGKARYISKLLLRHRWAHIIATDAHSPLWRSPSMAQAVEETAKIIGHEKALAMASSIPEAILNDRDVAWEEPIEYGERR